MTADKTGTKTALVTGGFGGIGLATTLRLAQDGWRVYATGRQLARGAALAARAQALGLDARPLALDVTDEASIRAGMQQIEQECGRLDVLVNNAGITIAGAVTDSGNRQLRQMFDTNVIGMVAVTRAALPLMAQHGGGRVINLSSALGKVTFPGVGVYSATKFAIEALSDAMRLEFKLLGPGFHVIVIEPGFIKTELGEHSTDAEYASSSPYGAEYLRLVNQTVSTAIERAPGPEAVAEVVARAVTDRRPRSRYAVTGSAAFLMALRRLLPDGALDRVVLSITGLGKYRPVRSVSASSQVARN